MANNIVSRTLWFDKDLVVVIQIAATLIIIADGILSMHFFPLLIID